jgi:hypothetical protein
LRKLLKTSIAASCLALVVLYLTSASQALVSDGNRCYSVVYWKVPFYGLKTLPDNTWWVFVRIWVLTLLTPVVLWIVLGAREIVARLRPH